MNELKGGMLDIQGGQSAPVATAVATPATPARGPMAAIPTVASPSNQLTYITAGLVLAVLIAAGGYVSFVRADRAATIATRNREITQLRAQLGTPDRVKAASVADQLKLSVGAVQGALTTTSPWTPLLTVLADRTPSGVVLTAAAVDAKLNVRLNGNATSYGDVARFMAALEGSQSFNQVTLDTTAKSDSTTGQSVAFTLHATFVPPAALSTAAQPAPAASSHGAAQ